MKIIVVGKSAKTVQTSSAVSAASSKSDTGTNSKFDSNVRHNETVDTYQETITSTDLLQLVYDGQLQIKTQLASLQASVDIIMANVYQTTPENTDRLEKYIIRPVRNRQELQKLEDQLKNENIFLKTFNAMTFICGSSGKSKGADSCYKLIDNFFSRDLLVNCSWTGSSRQTDEGKIPLKYFYNTRKLFLKLIRKADKDFTEQDCDKFFKTIIKNAKQRLHPKIMSTAKQRPRKSTTESIQKRLLAPVLEEGEQEENQVEEQNNQRGMQEPIMTLDDVQNPNFSEE